MDIMVVHVIHVVTLGRLRIHSTVEVAVATGTVVALGLALVDSERVVDGRLWRSVKGSIDVE